jgi:hypothetical protein
MGSRVWLARGGRGIAGGEHQIVKAIQDEASPPASRREFPKAQVLLLSEREGVLRWNPCDGREEALASAGVLTKSAKNETNSSVRLGSTLATDSKSLASIGPASPRCELWNFWSRSRAAARFSGPLNETPHRQKLILNKSELALWV